MRSSLPDTGAATPSTCTSTVIPGRSRDTSCVPTLPASSSRARSTIVSTFCSGLSFSPGSTWRFATTPEMGATSSASRRLIRLVPSCICDAVNCARADSSAALLASSAVEEMNCCSARRWFAACWRSAWFNWARADSSAAPRSATLLLSSARSSVPSVCPARTLAPSPTASDSKVPFALARTTAVLGATSGPANSIATGKLVSRGATTSCWANSSVTLASSAFLRSASRSRDCCRASAPPTMAARHRALIAPTIHCLCMVLRS